ncbi:MAG: FAD-binding oxidoreductase [Bdellovibrionaceae bacterium]|nr:FAD-binding oxidoreductase [Pseudobdellovibrionaceae bacterium]
MNIDKLSTFLGKEQISTEPSTLKLYGKDWTKHFTANPSAIVFPKNTAEVKKIVQWAIETKTPLVPSGGRTGLSAGAYATQKEVVVSLEKMNQILDFDDVERTVSCQAGVVTEALQNYALDRNLYYPVDFAARGSSQIGGNIATNAGGIKVIRYGLTRDWVKGLTVVTGKGEILELNKSLVKNASGYDLRHLFIGSEGTLGFITECQIQLTHQPKELKVFLFALPQLEAIMEVYKSFSKNFALSAFEMFTDVALKYVRKQGHVNSPLEIDAPYYVLVEIEEENDSSLDIAMELFELNLEKGLIVDGTLAQNSQQAKDIWRLREDITEATTEYSPYKNDVSVRVSKVHEFIVSMDKILKADYPEFDVVWFGHIGDGNLHINILKPQQLNSETFMKKCHDVDDKLFALIEKLGGSISAEHGVGLVKKPFLHHTRSPEEIAYMKAIKTAFDPHQILNPGKML